MHNWTECIEADCGNEFIKHKSQLQNKVKTKTIFYQL